jgi:hypothetical protein
VLNQSFPQANHRQLVQVAKPIVFSCRSGTWIAAPEQEFPNGQKQVISNGKGQATKPDANCKRVKHLNGPHGFQLSTALLGSCCDGTKGDAEFAVVLHLHFDWE